jgi:NitT/TauT family transport system permease protein
MNTDVKSISEAPPLADSPTPDDGAPGRWRIVAAVKARPEWVLSPLLLVVILTMWELLVASRPDLEFLISRPGPVFQSLLHAIISPTTWTDIGTTASEALAGFGIGFVLAIAVGIGVVILPKLEEVLVPYLIASYAVPVLVTAPLFVMWFGYGFPSKAVIAAFTSFFPMLVNILNGFRQENTQQVEMLTAYKASRAHIFRLSRFPNAVPFVFTAMDVGLIFAMLGAIVGEFAGATQGLGYRVLQDSYNFAIADLFVTLFILALLGFLAHTAVMFAQRKVAFWITPPQGLMV